MGGTKGGASLGHTATCFEALKRGGGCVGCLESYRYQLSVLEDWRYRWMSDGSLRKEELQDAIPILRFALGPWLSLKIRPRRERRGQDGVQAEGQRGEVLCGHRWTERLKS